MLGLTGKATHPDPTAAPEHVKPVQPGDGIIFLGAASSRRIHVPVAAHLYEALHAQRLRGLHEVVEVLVRQDGCDQQDGVRPAGARLVDLVSLYDELLAQQRALDAGRADELQVLEAPLRSKQQQWRYE